MKNINLLSLSPGDKAYIKNNDLKNNKNHLQSLGIMKGNEIKCLYKSPFNDPVAYLIKNTIIAIRNEDAAKIYITKENENGSI